MKLAFTVIGPPQPKERARRGRNGHWYTPKRTQRYERAVRVASIVAIAGAHVCGEWPRDARYRVDVTAYFGDARRRDADNVGKAVLDALNPKNGWPGYWGDDSQVASLTVRREIDRANPRTEVHVEVL